MNKEDLENYIVIEVDNGNGTHFWAYAQDLDQEIIDSDSDGKAAEFSICSESGTEECQCKNI